MPVPTDDGTTVPVGPSLSMFDPIYLGIDEFGAPVYLELVYRNLLAGGEPGGGKSGLLNTIAAHAALSTDTRLVLFDGKLVELGMWEQVADEFVGPDITHALDVLRRLQVVMNNRYAWLRAHHRRKISPVDGLSIITVIVDEIAYYSATVGTKQEQEEFVALLRDLVARGRAAGIPVVAATQRPSFDIIPTSLRDLFGYRAAFRCTTPNSSNIVLGHGWAEQGYSATDISPTNQGSAYLIAEGGIPRRIKVAYLTDGQIQSIADYAAWIRHTHGLGVDEQHAAHLATTAETLTERAA
ncbi:MAG TPA: FtsK/SpoIIIE domain-containing protein [Micromonosporaceae bacterium]